MSIFLHAYTMNLKQYLLLVFLAVGVCTNVACKKDKSEACYVFTTLQTSSISPNYSGSGYPQTSTVNTEQCGLTQDAAKQLATTLTSTSSATTGGITLTITQVTTYQKK